MDKTKNEPTTRELALEQILDYESDFQQHCQKLDPPKTAEELQNIILEILHENQAVTRITTEIREQLKQWIEQPQIEKTQEDETMREVGEYLVHHPHVRHVVLTRVADEIERKYGIHSDAIDIRLLVHKINEASTEPKVLGLPNYRHADRPLYTRISSDDPLPPEVAELLKYFNF